MKVKTYLQYNYSINLEKSLKVSHIYSGTTHKYSILSISYGLPITFSQHFNEIDNIFRALQTRKLRIRGSKKWDRDGVVKSERCQDIWWSLFFFYKCHPTCQEPNKTSKYLYIVIFCSQKKKRARLIFLENTHVNISQMTNSERSIQIILIY